MPARHAAFLLSSRPTDGQTRGRGFIASTHTARAPTSAARSNMASSDSGVSESPGSSGPNMTAVYSPTSRAASSTSQRFSTAEAPGSQNRRSRGDSVEMLIPTRA